MRINKYLLIGVLLMQVHSSAYAHSGKTDASGCHTEKKTGEYHCHDGESKTAKIEARTSAPQGKETIICTANIYNCPDLTDAQRVYEQCLEEVGADIHDLDRDDDGTACES